MSRVIGVVFIAAGLATAGYLVSGTGSETSDSFAAQVETPRSPVVTVPAEQPPRPIAQAVRIEPPKPAAPKAEIVLRPIEPQKAARAGARPDDESRLALARDIQRELRRVGCYTGDVTGEWSPSTKQAMKTFIDRVNASLPIDEPDFILKALVQGHPGNACGTGCGPGQAMAGDGRCMPSAVVAQAKRPIAPPATVTAPSHRPQVAEAQGQRAPSSASNWETRVLQAPPAAPAAVAAPSAAPPPGRMAIGGPRNEGAPQAAGSLGAVAGPVVAGEPPLAGAIAAARIEAPRRRALGTEVDDIPQHNQQATVAGAVAAGAAGALAARRPAQRAQFEGAQRAVIRPPVGIYQVPVAAYRPPPRRYYYAPTRERVASQAFWRRVTNER